MTRRPAVTRQPAVLRLVPEGDESPAPTLRPDRVAQARERIHGHYYDRADVRRALVEALLVELAAPQETHQA